MSVRMPSPSELSDAGILAPRQAEVYVLREIQGHSREEAASALGISPNTVDRHLQEARAKIDAARTTLELLDGDQQAVEA